MELHRNLQFPFEIKQKVSAVTFGYFLKNAVFAAKTAIIYNEKRKKYPPLLFGY